MIRRDYILRMLEEFFELLSRLRSLKQGQLWDEAAGTLDQEFQRLTHAGAEAVAKLSETELLARLIQGEPTQVVRDKTFILTALLKEAGDVAAGREQFEQRRVYYLKGLHLLLNTLAAGEAGDFPDFVPGVELFVGMLGESALPVATRARLMQHYERAGEFGKAEDLLYSILEGDADRAAVADFGVAFYERLQRQSDASLEAGNLPRAELEAGLTELRRQRPSIR